MFSLPTSVVCWSGLSSPQHFCASNLSLPGLPWLARPSFLVSAHPFTQVLLCPSLLCPSRSPPPPLPPPPGFFLSLFLLIERVLVLHSNSFLSYHVRNFFLYCEIFSATREMFGLKFSLGAEYDVLREKIWLC